MAEAPRGSLGREGANGASAAFRLFRHGWDRRPSSRDRGGVHPPDLAGAQVRQSSHDLSILTHSASDAKSGLMTFHAGGARHTLHNQTPWYTDRSQNPRVFILGSVTLVGVRKWARTSPQSLTSSGPSSVNSPTKSVARFIPAASLGEPSSPNSKPFPA